MAIITAVADEPAQETASSQWTRSVRAAVPVWATAYAAYTTVTAFAWFAPAEGPRLLNLLSSWHRYDSIRYARLVEFGYADPADTADRSFFPLYPMLARGLDLLLPGGAFAAMLTVSAVSLLAMLTVLYRLVATEEDQSTARRAMWLVVAFPSAFFLAFGFNESLFIALALGSVYAMRRGNWWAAGALGGLAALTRSAGIVLCVAFAYEYLRQHGFSLRRFRADVLAGALIPAGLGLFMLYLWLVAGDAFAFANSGNDTWGRSLALPSEAIIQTFDLMAGRRLLSNHSLHMILDLLLVVFIATVLVLGVVGPWKLRRDQLGLVVLGAALLIFSISFPPDAARVEPLMGAPRYVLEVFPAFLILAKIRPAHLAYGYVAVLLQGALLAHYVRGGWIA